jgi:hypothetical protein
VTPSPCLVHTKVPDYERFCPLFGWLPTATIKRIFEIMTQPVCTYAYEHCSEEMVQVPQPRAQCPPT